MKLNLLIDNKVVSIFIKYEHLSDLGVIVEQLITAKLEGGRIDYNEATIYGFKLQAITIKFYIDKSN